MTTNIEQMTKIIRTVDADCIMDFPHQPFISGLSLALDHPKWAKAFMDAFIESEGKDKGERAKLTQAVVDKFPFEVGDG